MRLIIHLPRLLPIGPPRAPWESWCTAFRKAIRLAFPLGAVISDPMMSVEYYFALKRRVNACTIVHCYIYVTLGLVATQERKTRKKKIRRGSAAGVPKRSTMSLLTSSHVSSV